MIFADNQELRPDIQGLNELGFFEGYTHQATMAYFHDEMKREALMERLFDAIKEYQEVEAGISTTYKYGIIIRILANSSYYLECITRNIRNVIYNTRNSI